MRCSMSSVSSEYGLERMWVQLLGLEWVRDVVAQRAVDGLGLEWVERVK